MNSNTTVEPHARPTTYGRRRVRIYGLVFLVLALGLVLTVLESGLSDEPIPSYVSSSDFDVEAYEQLVYSGQPVCSDAGELVASGQVECVPFDDHGGFAYPVVLTAIAALGALLVLRWGNQIGWLLILGPLVDLVGAVAGAYAVRGTMIEPGSLPGGRLAALVGSVTWILLLVVIVPRFLMTIPNGRLPSRGWRWAVRFTYVVAAALGIIALFHPMLVGSIPNPIALPWSVETADSLAGFAIQGMLACWAIAGLALVIRIIRSLRHKLSS